MLKVMFNKGITALLNPATQTRAWVRLITKRLLRLAVAAALLLVIYNVWNIASLKSQQQLTQHTRHLAQLLLSQVEHQTLQLLRQQDEQALAETAQHLQQHAEVVAVVIRSPLGESIAASGSYDSVIDWPADAPATPWFMTRELRVDGETLGYLQVTFDQAKLLQGSTLAHDG
ncbi:MAG TPA: hypothetical protein DCF92_05090, partial [Idiomarina sp.]|nr:hypothetical protein [Idiomarina sp.]